MALLANKHNTMIVGVDIHLIVTPLGVTVPTPHPFIGYVFDPADCVPNGCTVFINGQPAGRHITAGVMNTQVHIPIGGSFANAGGIANEAVVFYGNNTVFSDGEALGGASYQVMTCDDLGIPLPGHKGLFKPNSSLIPIPAAKQVMIGSSLAPGISNTGQSNENDMPMACMERVAEPVTNSQSSTGSGKQTEPAESERTKEEKEEKAFLTPIEFSI